jgi:HAD superfamily hydrolase (TIGR01549 family)
MSYDAVLFDMDGVLLHGAETVSWIYETAARRALDDFDAHDPDHKIDSLEGFHYTPAMESTCQALGVDVAAFWERRESYAATLENRQLREGERKPFDDITVLEELVGSHRLGLVSNNRQATVEQMISVCGLEFMDVAIGRDHSLAGYDDRKPEPTMLRAALRELDTEAGLYVGDSAKDVVAADRAGIDSAFLYRSHNDDIDLDCTPTIELTGLADLIGHVGTPVTDS